MTCVSIFNIISLETLYFLTNMLCYHIKIYYSCYFDKCSILVS